MNDSIGGAKVTLSEDFKYMKEKWKKGETFQKCKKDTAFPVALYQAAADNLATGSTLSDISHLSSAVIPKGINRLKMESVPVSLGDDACICVK